MSAAPWYAWFPGDYMRDTRGLSWTEDLAYRRLLESYYSQGAPIEHKQRYRTVGAATRAQRDAVDAVLAQFFTRDGERWRNRRADRELKFRAKLAERARAGGLRSAAVRKKKGSTPLQDPLREAQHPTTTSTSTCTTTPTATAGDVSPATPPRALGASPSARTKRPRSDATNVARPGNGVTAAIWAAYAQAHRGRYGVEPVRNARVNGQLARVVQLLGEEAPQVAAFYVGHQRAAYVRATHAVSLLLRDAEGLRTEWATGRAVTETEARQADRTQATGNWVNDLIEERHAGK